MNHNCYVCQTMIPNGSAVIRSIAFVQTAFHTDCYSRYVEAGASTVRTHYTRPLGINAVA